MTSLVRLAGLSAGVLQDADGNALASREINVYLRGTTTQAQAYADSAGVTPLSQPLVSDATGQVPGYVESGVSVDFFDVLTTQRMQAEPLRASGVPSVPAVGTSGNVPVDNGDGTYTWAPGTPGPPGATGNGAVFQSVDSLHASPRSVTDWGTILNAAVAAGTTHFVFGPFDYPFSTQLDLRDRFGLIFEGSAGLLWNGPGTVCPSRLTWTGAAGSGNAIRCGGSQGLIFHDIGLVYSATGYDGDLTTWGSGATGAPTAFCRLERVYLGSDDGVKATARSIVNAHGAVTLKINNARIGDAISGYRGYDSHPYVSNDNSINGVVFTNCSLGGIVNPGLGLRVTDCDWEYGTMVNMAGITNDVSGAADFFHLADCRFWDAIASTQTAITQIAGVSWVWKGERLDIHLAKTQVSLLGTGSVDISNVTFDTDNTNFSPIDVGPVATAPKDRIIITGCSWGLTGTAPGIANLEGHEQVYAKNNGATGNSSIGSSREAVAAHLYVTRGNPNPAFAAHAGVTLGGNSTVNGSDSTGVIMVEAGGTALTAGALAADVTFAIPMVSTPGRGAYSSNIIVMLTPLDITSGTTASGSDAVAAGAFASVVGAAIGGQTFTGWSIGFANGLGASKRVAYAYQVVVL